MCVICMLHILVLTNCHNLLGRSKADLQHLLPVETDEVFIQLISSAPLSPGLLVLGQQASKVDVTILQHHVDGAF